MRKNKNRLSKVLTLLLLYLGTVSLVTTVQARCPDYTKTRKPYFGDIHSHSTYSLDAFLVQTLNDPWDSYQFAKKEKALPLTPIDDDSEPTRRVEIDRPLDFAAVTDHAEFLTLGSKQDCSYDGRPCPDTRFTAWRNIQRAANENYEPCRFTTFIAYEYTLQKRLAATDTSPKLQSMLHRNIIFRNSVVPDRVFGALLYNRPDKLWRKLNSACLQAKNKCDVLVIPHNSNLSNGLMFPEISGKQNEASKYVDLQRKFEPLLEIIQHKGASECLFAPGLGGEEACQFEQLSAFRGIGGGASPQQSNKGYAREALKTGLKLLARLGRNPYEFGFIGSTDNHNGAPGQVSERNWLGHNGVVDDTSDKLLDPQDVNLNLNPGGLAAVWAEENTRDAIFKAMRRKETYATSGTRLLLRFFAGWNYQKNLCQRRHWLKKAYHNGVPMGGELGAKRFSKQTSVAPTLVIAALKDGGTVEHPGNNLAQIEVVKGWIDSQGETHEKVFNIYGEPLAEDIVDRSSCLVDRDLGFSSVCTTWRDPEFDPQNSAFYYVRVTEVPSCRWSQYEANRAGVEHPVGVPAIIRERAWSSPIWIKANRG